VYVYLCVYMFMSYDRTCGLIHIYKLYTNHWLWIVFSYNFNTENKAQMAGLVLLSGNVLLRCSEHAVSALLGCMLDQALRMQVWTRSVKHQWQLSTSFHSFLDWPNITSGCIQVWLHKCFWRIGDLKIIPSRMDFGVLSLSQVHNTCMADTK